MFDFLKRDNNNMEETLQKLGFASAHLQLALHNGDLKYSDKEIQFFIPLILYFTDWTWLDIVAKNNFSKDYETISHFLKSVEKLTEINGDKLQKEMEATL